MRLTDVDALIDDVKYRYCKDCDRRKGIKKGKWRVIYEVGDVPCRACDVDDMLYELEKAPTANVHDTNVGKWINISISANGNESSAERDLCGARVHNNLSSVINYCPNCGAKMDEVEDETN